MSSHAELPDYGLDEVPLDELRMIGPLYDILVPHHLDAPGDKYFRIGVVGNFAEDEDRSRYQQVLDDLPVDDEFIMRRLRTSDIAKVDKLTNAAARSAGGLVVRTYMRQAPPLTSVDT